MISKQKERCRNDVLLERVTLLNQINSTLTTQVKTLSEQNERLKQTILEESTVGAKQIIENLNEDIKTLRRKIISLTSENLYLHNKLLEKEEMPIDEQYQFNQSKEKPISDNKEAVVLKELKGTNNRRGTRNFERPYEEKDSNLDRVTYDEIMNKYNIRYSTASRWVRRYCENFKTTSKTIRKYYEFDKLSKSDINFIKTKSTKEIMDKFGVKKYMVYRWHTILHKQ